MIPSEQDSAIGAIEKQSAKLNGLSDEAGELVRRTEEFLSACGVGGESSVLTRAVPEGEAVAETYLSYRRVGPRHRLAIEDYPATGEGSVRAWGDGARADKLEALAHLPTVLQAIAEKLASDAAGAEEAVRAVATMLAALPGPAASNGVARHPRFDVDAGRTKPPKRPKFRPADEGEGDDIPF